MAGIGAFLSPPRLEAKVFFSDPFADLHRRALRKGTPS
jgi:hypothetical protein